MHKYGLKIVKCFHFWYVYFGMNFLANFWEKRNYANNQVKFETKFKTRIFEPCKQQKTYAMKQIPYICSVCICDIDFSFWCFHKTTKSAFRLIIILHLIISKNKTTFFVYQKCLKALGQDLLTCPCRH